MAKQIWKPGNMVYPLPAVMVSTGDKKGNQNILTVAWTGTVCTNPAMVYISVRPESYSYHMIEESGEFVINLTTEKLARATDFCGVRSGRDVDKWKECHLTAKKAEKLTYAPVIEEAPVNIECVVTKIEKLGSPIWMRRANLNSIRQVFWHIPMENILDLEKRSERLDTA